MNKSNRDASSRDDSSTQNTAREGEGNAESLAEPRRATDTSPQGAAQSGPGGRDPSDPSANRADWVLPEGGGSREDVRERVHDGAPTADEPPPGASVGGTGTGEPSGDEGRGARRGRGDR